MQVEDRNGDEEDGYDEGACHPTLYNINLLLIIPTANSAICVLRSRDADDKTDVIIDDVRYYTHHMRVYHTDNV